MEVWLNPDSLTLGAPTATANGPGTSAFTGGVTHFGLTTIGDAATIEWDNLRIATTMESVVIPEPATFLLLSIGLGVMATLRRRMAVKAR